MNYEQMSDFDINRLVAERLGIPISKQQDDSRQSVWVTVDGFGVEVNYCNNASDAWSIIIDNKISMQKYDDGWYVTDGDIWALSQGYMLDEMYSNVSDNPLRSAMIVFLMMGDNDESEN